MGRTVEPNLSLPRKKIVAQLALWLGFSRGVEYGDPAQSDYEKTVLDEFVDSGLRQVYSPPPLNGRVHQWSFLHPIRSIAIGSGCKFVELPDDFAGLEGQIYLLSSGTQQWFPIELHNETTVEREYALSPSSTGPPKIAALTWEVGTHPTHGQRASLRVWPATDQAYTLRVQYYFQPDATDGSKPYAYGGSAMSELYLESCLAIAESRLDNVAQGPRFQQFMIRLAAAIGADLLKQPEKLGYNGDNSDARRTGFGRRWIHEMGTNPVTINGSVSS